jgi:hypothetical protein
MILGKKFYVDIIMLIAECCLDQVDAHQATLGACVCKATASSWLASQIYY